MKRGTKFFIKALNQERIFEHLRRQGVEIYDLKRTSKFNATFSVKNRNLVTTLNAFKKFAIEEVRQEKIGLSKILQIAKARAFVAVGLALAIIFGITANFFVFKVDVFGLRTLSKQEILCFLNKNHQNIGLQKSNINNAEIELALVEQFPQISMVSVATRGCTLIINIKEKENYTSPATNANIVADFNGRIISIAPTSGVAKVKQGDIVRFGDVLIATDNPNVDCGVVPAGKITAEVWCEETIVHHGKTIQQVRTGKTFSSRSMFCFGLNIFSSNAKVPFSEYQTETYTTVLQNTILPLKIVENRSYELKTTTKIEVFEDVKDNIVGQCRKNALQKTKIDDIIQKEDVVIRQDGVMTFVTYIITAQRQIS